MEKVDRVLSFLAYTHRTARQLLDVRNLKYCHLIFRGFTPDKGHYYDFKKYGYKSYVTDTTRYTKTVFINYNNRNLIADKYSCYLFLRQFTDKTVPVLGLVDEGEVFVFGGYKTSEELFKSYDKIILKPRRGRGGDGVLLARAEAEKLYLNNKEISSLEEGVSLLKDYILVPYVEPHSYSKSIFPDSLNTIRILTCVINDEVVILKAGHRFGTDSTSNVDNVCHGGLSATIDIATGIINDTIIVDRKQQKKFKVDVHPITKEKILGVEIPRWQSVKESIIKLHEAIKFVKYVGWDIAITPDDYRIIEANYASDLDAPQLHEPLLLDKNNLTFFSALK